MEVIRKILAAIRNADHEFGLIKQNDRIMVGVSGGKDSLVLCHCLYLYQKFAYTNFTFQPVMLDLGFPKGDLTALKEYFNSINQELIIANCHEVYEILKIQQKDKPNLSCSICSRMKKAAINKVAKEMGFNKVAFAHHADDAIETLLMNEMYGGRVATFAPYMHLSEANIDFIRPLIYARESDIERLAKDLNLPVYHSKCPNDKKTMREVIKQQLNIIYQKYPFAKNNFLVMLSNQEHFDLWMDKIRYSIEGSNITFSPVYHENQFKTLLSFWKDNHKKLAYDASATFYLFYLNEELVGSLGAKIENDVITFSQIIFKSHSSVYHLPSICKKALIKHLQIQHPNAKYFRK